MELARRALALCTILVTTAALGLPAEGAPAAPDGLTAQTPALSCWAIKQAYPASPSGSYWLQTPRLVTAQRFYCDMSYDGGGWVLVARGRDGWLWDHNGQGTPNAIRSTPSGTAAFPPAALPAPTVDGLLNGQRPDALADGIRIRRARHKEGNDWQEVRWFLASLDRWSWGFPGGYNLDETRIEDKDDDDSWNGGNTYDSRVVLPGQQGSGVGTNDEWRRLYTWTNKSHGNRGGFSYGSGVSGQSNATSYLWQKGSEKQAIAFTQVFIRPRLTSASWPAMPDQGVPAEPLRPLLVGTTSLSTPWGVTGVYATSDKTPNIPGLALGQVGDTMFVGGKFRNVQQGPAGPPVAQGYLAGFDVTTGEWRSQFRPVLNGAVWDILGTADGRLIVAGEFTSVNGAPNTRGLAALDPVTGAVLASWRAEVDFVDVNGNQKAFSVRSMDEQDGWIYISGDFTRLRGGDPMTAWMVIGRLGRVRLTDGRPSGTWKPNITAPAIDLDASPQGDRVHVVGNFAVAGTTRKYSAAFSTADGKLVPGLAPYIPSGTGAKYQQAILEVGDRVVQGGAQHNIHLYDRGSYQLLRSHITKRGGDFQAIATVDGVIYAACHCVNWNYQDTNTWPTPAGYSRVDEMTFIGAYDGATMEHLPEFQARFTTDRGAGPWDMVEDSNGCLWFAGDMSQGSWQTSLGGYQWLGGFGKLCPRNTVPPTTPQGLTAQRVGPDVALSWGAATDDVGAVKYELLRDGRVILTTTARAYTDRGVGAARYAVRAIDPPGNRSATTPVAPVDAA
jgi:hypothetical protein